MSEKISDWFKVATSGPTIDGRKIEASWLEDMASTYNPAEYCASIFEEHFSFLGNYGYVHELKTEKDDKGRTCLYARIAPSPRLYEANKDGQLMYTSIKVNPDFANTGKCYLEHLAVTDTPASLGTDRLSFSKENPQSFAFTDGAAIRFSETPTETPPEMPAWRKAFNKFIGREDDSDMKKEELEKLFSKLNSMETDLSKLKEQVNQGGDDDSSDDPPDLKQAFSALQNEVEQLRTQISDSEKDEFGQKVDALETGFKELSQQLQDALKDAGSAPPPQLGDVEEGEFSVV